MREIVAVHFPELKQDVLRAALDNSSRCARRRA